MSAPDNPETSLGNRWEGLKEIDRAIAENRLTAYTWMKTWADPWGRAAMVTVFTLLTAYVIFVIINDLIL